MLRLSLLLTHLQLYFANAAGTADPLLRGGGTPQSNVTPLNQLKDAANTIGMRFKAAESTKTFGSGLSSKLVSSVKSDSEEFWKDVQELTPEDTSRLTREDAKDLQKVVQQVAQMDDDINSPQRQKQVQSEYDMIQSELSDVDI